ncbi:uncharacterized protein L201_007693 [Kwoniella dendrophila CBS 6074]|uniref:Coenzyme Q-binding protein COQ10 START domain-containing protein n=1 Tax=Kwoniella dendrophila CBS 6074 TaxID=1295534 RepID=A0AAX4K6I1_9TREE
MASSSSTARTISKSLIRSTSKQCQNRSIIQNSIVKPVLACSNNTSSRYGVEQQQQRRTFFSLPDITKLAGLVPGSSSSGSQEQTSDAGVISGIETDGEEQRFHARKILPYSQSQLYSLVSDVPSYSSFIPFCNSSTVLSKPSNTNNSGSSSTQSRQWKDWSPGIEPFEVLAELSVGFGGLEERYISKVIGIPFESVTATASNKTPLFKSLITRWSFSPASTYSPHPTSSIIPPLSSSNPSTNKVRKTNTNSISNEPIDPNLGPTLLTIDLNFNFANPLHRIASQAVLPKVADKMVEAFEKRCLQVYGKGDQ